MFVLHFNSIFNQQVYGQCKAVMYMNRVHRVTRLYKYSCTVRPGNNQSPASCFFFLFFFNHHMLTYAILSYICSPLAVPTSKIRERCPDCPVQLPEDHEAALRTVKMGMEKYNNESGLANYFVPLNITRVFSQVSK